MKKINKTLLGARNQDLGQLIQEANFLEELQTKGKTLESVVDDAKTSLGLESKQSVIAEWESAFKNINILQKNFIDTNALTERLVTANMITDEEVSVLQGIESRIGDELKSVFGLDTEDLYEEE